uniref:Short-chain dehydrogenase/reductase n=1 Tax=Kalanchoe fedtschenkoi TaxID=63787 RepID=A0A7N0UEU7_KALFE
MSEATRMYAVVTGGNKGIGFEICRQLASKGVLVILTARNEQRGSEAVEKLKACGLSDRIVFHQLDVADPSSVAAVADFVRTQFGKLDILVNNAAAAGIIYNADNFLKAVELVGNDWPLESQVDWSELATQTYEMAEECLKTNYYGVTLMVKALLPLLELSDSARIVNVSSMLGTLAFIPNEWAKGVFTDHENLTEDAINDVLVKFLKDFKESSLKENGWPIATSAYTLSKAAMNAYTRLIAKSHPAIVTNSVCPGFVKTDLTLNAGVFTAEEGAEFPVKLALLPNDSPSGLFYAHGKPRPI